MTNRHLFSEYAEQLRTLIHQCFAVSPMLNNDRAAALDQAFDQLALRLFSLQYSQVAPYRRVCDSQSISPDSIKTWRQIPSVPTTAFKDFDFSSLAVHERTTVFHSSGTTAQRPSRHYHHADSLTLYEASLLPWFRACVLPKAGLRERQRVIALTPAPSLAPHSSLVYMFETLRRALGDEASTFTGVLDATGAWTLDFDATIETLQHSIASKQPVILLGTAFLFVHLLDGLKQRGLRLRLACGSRVVETGGYKGRSREIPKFELHRGITEWLGVPAGKIVSEYGMSELSSQAYDSVVTDCDRTIDRDEAAEPRRVFRFPPWAQAQIISPETGLEVELGETGLIRVCDLANVRSVISIQTEDLGIRRNGGFELLGRAALAELRGCSLMAI